MLGLFKSYSEREVKRVRKIVEKINKLDEKMQSLSDEELKAKTQEFKERYKKGETLEELLVEVFAVCKEASSRVLEMKQFDVQLIGGVVLHQGRIAEMKTGEGKTLTEVCPAYLNSITGEGVHIVTVNDYLAERDRELMKPLYDYLGVSTGVVISNINPQERKDAYSKDITYITNNELGFDYLKDNMVKTKESRVQRGLNFAIVDEVDSILIDEARTPLIISGQGDEPTNLYQITDVVVKSLSEEDYKVDEKERTVTLTESGVAKIEKFFGIDNYSDLEHFDLRHHVGQALKANFDMKKDIDYMPKNNEIYIVDEFTGRIAEGRRYSDGLHQALEAKEGVRIQSENKTLASITYQNLFKSYKKLSGMTGTAQTEEEEFRETYNLDVIVIPTNKPIQRIDREDKLYSSRIAKVKAIIKDIVETHTTGQPILIGTSSIEKSEELSELLSRKNIPHNVLNAKFHEQEAHIIEKAGMKGAVTIATNMAGRGTDIKIDDEVKKLGGLKVIGTERADNRRIDNQLVGRSGRQGDPGESIFYLSFEDDLLRVFSSPEILDKLEHSLNKNGQSAVLIQNKFFTKRVREAQKRIEGMHFESRKDTMKYDGVINKQREIIYSQRNEVLDTDNLVEFIDKMVKEVVSSKLHTLRLKLDDETYIDKSIEEIFIDYLDEINPLLFNKDFVTVDRVLDVYNKNNSIEEVEHYLYEKSIDKYNLIKQSYDEYMFSSIVRGILLSFVDLNWMEYLESITHIKQASQLASYKQQDPLQVFTLDSFEEFNELVKRIKISTVVSVFNIELGSGCETF